MIQSENQNNKAKEKIKTAWSEGDLLGLISAGLDNFLSILFNGTPITFRRFLEDTSYYFDKYIQDISCKERLHYIGGKMTLGLEGNGPRDVTLIRLSAVFYFQTWDKKWIVKEKNGNVYSDRFSDWDTDAQCKELRKAGKLELSIEPPEDREG